MIGVADTSPICSLLRIGQLDLLRGLFESVHIPLEVAAELDEGESILGPWRDSPSAALLSIRRATNRALYLQLSTTLHKGEAAAITLAAETPGALLVIDDKDGRAAARRLDLRITGVLGVVLAAKRIGSLRLVGPVIEQLRTTGGLWLGQSIVRHALTLAGEG